MPKFSTEALRTVALVGHGASGKTTLTEALLKAAGMIQAAGSVERGSTVCDFDPIEKQYLHSLRSAIVHLDYANTRTHLIDTPGYPDFIGQAIGALDAVETAAVAINAQTGVEMIANRMMNWAAKRKLCRILIVNKIDAENVNLPQVLANL
ncbi:MAG TPA: GTP-binding protein, partial [Burkholderiales bacterium]|nr:GTP-binding protein [Burkholderiales bacterium]